MRHGKGTLRCALRAARPRYVLADCSESAPARVDGLSLRWAEVRLREGPSAPQVVASHGCGISWALQISIYCHCIQSVNFF